MTHIKARRGKTLLLGALLTAGHLGAAQGGENLFRNPDFGGGAAAWQLGFEEGAARASGDVREGAYCVDVEEGGPDPWSLAVRQQGLGLTPGFYTLSFDAYSPADQAASEGAVGVKLGEAQEPFGEYFYEVQVLSQDATTYTFETELFAEDEAAQLELFLGGPLNEAPATLCFDNFALVKTKEAQVARDFPYIMVDQFGYRPEDPKVAVLADPQEGFNAEDTYVPGERLEVRTTDDEVVFSGEPEPWNGGGVQDTSGDKGWWFDFSALSEPGSYYLYDPDKDVRSYPFDIAEDVYNGALRAAVRMFYYNRANVAKEAPYADTRWTDGVSFTGPGQDTEARFVDDKTNVYTARDLSGGWFDAGDYNKYVTFAQAPVHVLLTAYEQSPDAFTDDFGIPESGNGLPDLIDELLWEFDWLKKMQVAEGGVIIKVGNIDYNSASPPSEDRRPRFYGPLCSSSTIAAASMFAHGALVFGQFEALSGYAADLQRRAVQAWEWYRTNPKRADCDDGEIKAGDADRTPREQREIEAVAAVYLFALTGEPRYEEAFSETYELTRPFGDPEPRWSMYNPDQGDALLYYTSLDDADRRLQQRIREAKASGAYGVSETLYREGARDLYRAYLPESSYHWGSNYVRASLGNTNLDMLHHGLDLGAHPSYQARALSTLHYFHGVNPLNLVYLSNMGDLGAERSASQIWHDWFADGTVWDDAQTGRGPAPGYVTGGPNADYSGQAAPPLGEPAQKAYRDWNSGSGEPWEITEPAIYYQAAYVRLLANFVEK